MGFRAAKISFDGSHYIATPKENFPRGKKRRRSSHPASEQETERKDQFETAYKESQKLSKKERKEYIKKAMEQAISDEEQRQEFVERNSERKKINAIRRKVRLSKKANLQTWNFFCTFTYDSEKHTEESFRKSLRNTLKHLVNRKGWKHIGVWERGGNTNRLHFHGIFYIPPNGMVGEIIETKDYSTKDNRMQTASQNTYFLERYGRNDFQKLILPHEVGESLKYLMKYIEKSGERLVYGGKLPAYFESDVLDEDIIVPYGIDDRKAVLADDFLCMAEGEIMGRVSPEVIEKMPKVN